MKKSFLAIMLAIILLIGILPGCKKAESTETTIPTLNSNEIAGVVMVNAGAPVEIMYNSSGSVLMIEGLGEKGLEFAPTLGGYVGKPCADVVADVITKSVEGKYLSRKAQTIVLKYVADSIMPSETFANEIASKAQAAIPNLPITQVRDNSLDSKGYIGADKAKELLELYLASSIVPTFEGRMVAEDGVYFFCASIDGALSYYTLNAITGDVSPCTKEDYENDFYSIYLDEEETFHQEETTFTEETYNETTPDQ